MMLGAIPGVAQAKGLWAVAKGWVLLGVALAIFSAGIYSGHRWESGATEKARRDRDNQANVAKQWKDRADGLDGVVSAFQRTNAENRKRDKEQQEQAERILAKLVLERQKAEDERADWQRRYAEAMESPDCMDLLKATSCAAFRSY